LELINSLILASYFTKSRIKIKRNSGVDSLKKVKENTISIPKRLAVMSQIPFMFVPLTNITSLQVASSHSVNMIFKSASTSSGKE
jgi:predicted nucleotide-binding protein (sugar kinase/HSP70/actin superfamily)